METQNFSPFSICSRHKVIRFDRPIVMGILNLTDDSFYDGGRYNNDHAMLAHAQAMVEEGADIIDIGAVSTRPGASITDPETEASQLHAAISLLRSHLPQTLFSVDTYNSHTAIEAIEAGADIINDISGGQFDPEMFPTVASLGVPYILMHTKGTPDQMMGQAQYDDLVGDLTLYFSQRLEQLYLLGVKDVWLDPGFGFAKTTQQNFELMNRLHEFGELFREPLLAGVSRKSMIQKTLGCSPDEALNGTTVLNTLALCQGARILRVHDPKAAREAITLFMATQQANPCTKGFSTHYIHQ